MTHEIRFVPKIRTSARAQPMFPVFIETVEGAIDAIQGLSLDKLEEDRWQNAHRALWDCFDVPNDPAKLAAAHHALCGALSAEDLLNEIKPSRI